MALTLTALPSATPPQPRDLPYWDDQRNGQLPRGYPCGTGCGIFTRSQGLLLIASSTSSRERTTSIWESDAGPIQLRGETVREGQSGLQLCRADDTVAMANVGQSVVGVKNRNTNFTQYVCDSTGGQSPPVSGGQVLTATLRGRITDANADCYADAPTHLVAGPNVPSPAVRAVGVYFPANGKFYAMGGRSADTAGSDFTNPFEFDPVANTWTTKTRHLR